MLSGIWVIVAEKLGVPAWPGFIGWSLFFFTGGDFEACKKSFPPIVLGPILAFLTAYTQTALNTSGITSALVVVVLGFVMTYAQNVSWFKVCSVTFVSCNIYFASGNLFHSIVVTSVGLIIGIISVKLGAFIDSAILKNNTVKNN